MSFKTLLLRLASSLLFSVTVLAHDPSQLDKPATIKILLVSNSSESLIEAKGPFNIYDSLTGNLIGSGKTNRRNTLTVQNYGLNWGEKFPGIYQLRIAPLDSKTTLLVDGIEYRGCLEVYGFDANVNVINEVDIESYLRSTLPLKFTAPLEEEAMNAVAIVERTNIFFQSYQNIQKSWHLDNRTISYPGTITMGRDPFIDYALEATRHAILVFGNKPFPASWTWDSAGQTISSSAILDYSISTPAGIQTPFAAENRNKSYWSYSIKSALLSKVFNIDRCSSIQFKYIPYTTKAIEINLTNAVTSKSIDFQKFQKALGLKNIKSNDISVSLQGDLITFTGFGEGLGSGLCLFSANRLAIQGEKAPKILSTFFPDTILKKIRTSNELLKR
jgi:stage II sporulation protein D